MNLPGDDMRDVIETAKILSVLPIQIVKLHSLYVPKGSRLYKEFEEGKVSMCSAEEYLERLVTFISYVRSDMDRTTIQPCTKRRCVIFKLGNQLVEIKRPV